MDPEAAGGQTDRSWQGLHLSPTHSFPEVLDISLQDFGLQNQLLSQHLRQWLLDGSANKHSHGTAKIHCHLATKMSRFAFWNIFPTYLKPKEGLAQSGKPVRPKETVS